MISEDQYQKQLASIEPQLESDRNTAFFNVAQYLMRKYVGEGATTAAEMRERMIDANATWSGKTGREKLPAHDIDRCAKQGAKDSWNYQCTKEPLKGFCNRALCLKRKFGVASKSEPLRVCRRLQLLRGWSYGSEKDAEELFA